MGSLSDPSDVGAEPLGDDRAYAATLAGAGRWASIDDLGVLWTNDSDSLQLKQSESADDAEAFEFRRMLIDYCTVGMTATEAFDVVVADAGGLTVESGSLDRLP